VKDPTSRLVRWRLKLAEYEYKVIYKAGKINLNADALSRNPAILNFPNETTPKTETRNRYKTLVDPTYGKNSASYPDPKAAPTLPTKNISAQDPCNFPKSIFPITHDEISYDTNTEIDDSSEDSDAPSLDTTDIPHQRFNVREIPDNFITRKDNLVIFITQQGEPCDLGARMLAEEERLPRIEDYSRTR